MKTCLIKQNAGIGDIFLCQKIAKLIQKETSYKNIIWPVLPEFSWIKDYLIDENINYINEELEFPYKNIYELNYIKPLRNEELLYIPLYKSSWFLEGEVMETKFKVINSTSENWQDFFTFKRNYEKENDLFYNKLNLTDETEFILINRRYSTKDYNGNISHKIENNKNIKTINLSYIDNYTLFDWCKVFEKAQEIHSVNTSINFILEKLKTTDKLFMYKRPEEDTNQFINEEYLFKKKYKRFL